MSFRSGWVAVALAAFAGAGCGSDGDTNITGGSVLFPGSSAEFTSTDGVLTTFVPAGAVEVETEVQVRPLTQEEIAQSLAGVEAVGPVYVFEPAIDLAVPATLRWNFPVAPPGAAHDSGNPRFLFGYSRGGSALVTPSPSTAARHAVNGSLEVTTETSELGVHVLTAQIENDDGSFTDAFRFGTLTADLNGGPHAVESPFRANAVVATPETLSVGVEVGIFADVPSGDITSLDSDEWDLDEGDATFYSDTVTLDPAMPWSPTPLPEWECHGAGPGAVSLDFGVYVSILDETVHASVEVEEPVDCIEREQKDEYTQQLEVLGAHIDDLEVPEEGEGEAMVDLAMNEGEYGYLIPVPAGGSIEVCVTASMAASVMYYPQYSPGYEFVDGEPGSGCTTITNIDPDNPNVVLVTITSAESPNNVTVTVTAVP